ncbi:hypothetical protein [Rhodococcus jostii]|uniref:hypothetical protein n=1 Tax=Rhodococcus jostii TaxID=132919 RepID=UPI003632350D
MSTGQRPRNRAFFPRMKVRSYGRLIRKLQRQIPGIDLRAVWWQGAVLHASFTLLPDPSPDERSES